MKKFKMPAPVRRGFSLFLLAAGLGAGAIPLSGCAGITDPVVPTYIPQNVRTYAGSTNGPMNGIYWSKSDAVRTRVLVEYAYARDTLRYQTARGQNEAALATANALQDRLFNPDTGLVTLGLAALGGGGLSVLTYRTGLRKPRPGDVTKEQNEAEKLAAGLQSPEKFRREYYADGRSG